MQAIILKSPDNGRFHFGVASPDVNTALSQTSERLHSDTLFSALVVLCAKTFPHKTEELIAHFKTGDIALSSGSFCVEFSIDGGAARRVFFLPKPVHFDWYRDEETDRKFFSGIKFISKAVWENGLTPYEWKTQGCFTVGKHFLMHPSEIQPEFGGELDSIYEMETVPKIADRIRRPENNIFFQTDLILPKTTLGKKTLKSIGFPTYSRFSAQPHFYFFLKIDDAPEGLKNLVHLLIDLLPDEGIGGGISTGCGKIISVEKVDCTLNLAEKNSGKLAFVPSGKISETERLSLSLIAPENESAAQAIKASKLITRGGRNTATDGYLQRVRMAREGAIVTGEVNGRIVPIHASGKYLRNGKAFTFPISEKFETTSEWLKEKR